jgi:hypothetical protein
MEDRQEALKDMRDAAHALLKLIDIERNKPAADQVGTLSRWPCSISEMRGRARRLVRLVKQRGRDRVSNRERRL